MSFEIEKYRMQIEGLEVLLADLSEVYDHIRDLCSEPPSHLNRATLSSFGGDLIRLHRQADISLAVLKLDLKKDKESISALAKTYRKDNYAGPHPISRRFPQTPAALDRIVNDDRYDHEDLPGTVNPTKKVTTTFDPLPF